MMMLDAGSATWVEQAVAMAKQLSLAQSKVIELMSEDLNLHLAIESQPAREEELNSELEMAFQDKETQKHGARDMTEIEAEILEERMKLSEARRKLLGIQKPLDDATAAMRRIGMEVRKAEEEHMIASSIAVRRKEELSEEKKRLVHRAGTQMDEEVGLLELDLEKHMKQIDEEVELVERDLEKHKEAIDTLKYFSELVEADDREEEGADGREEEGADDFYEAILATSHWTRGSEACDADQTVQDGVSADYPYKHDNIDESLFKVIERYLLGEASASKVIENHVGKGKLYSRFPLRNGPVALHAELWAQSIAKKLLISPALAAEEILLHGRTLSRVNQKWNKKVLVYEFEDFVGDIELFRCCRGRPVFAPDDSKGMTREWARKTVQVLASDKVLRPQILARKLRFLGQPLSKVVEGARVKVVFVKEDFLEDEKEERLQQVMVGCPVFLPDEGCEYVLTVKKKTRDDSDDLFLKWSRKMVYKICTVPELFDGILSKRIPLDGRRWSDIRLSPLSVWNEECVERHLFESCKRWRRSYTASRMITVDDFPQRKPDWAEASEEEYLSLLRDVAEVPSVVYNPPHEAKRIYHEYYNQKHMALLSYVHE